MADAEARADVYRELAGEKASKIDELQDEIKSLEKEIDRLGKIGEDSRHDNSGVNDGRTNSSIASNNGSSGNGRDKRIQSDAGNVLSFEATAYTSSCSGCSGITASGYDVRNTIHTAEGLRVLAAPKSIPFHTRMKVKLIDGTSFVGEVLDRGGAIDEGKLDILVEDTETALRIGRQIVEVEILH